ncbi:ribonuclease M5 [Caldisalinibacter kiritimatiensis]|uniref:Ribonuclease M5 n=1 Tax=Caldisalinibacter kiritimatiensis TaxID=1304284 RepID=R1AT13_9FIRM|nr:ribonuclease M5 [Caldisalinibacter kiritimatiensis]EOD00283.1 Ribonuclease M5 [Caldisalinibacter kiritimatiensis]
MIKEVIVVEGKDDVAAVKRAVDAEIITTGGFGFPDDLMDRIKTAAEKRGVIIFTDPDFAGEKIRNIISKEVKNCKHAFLPRDKATKDGNIGIENATKEDIIEALKNARVESATERKEFTKSDLIRNGLIGNESASDRRDKLGRILGIGYCNSKQFFKRLNNYGITREEFEEGVRRIGY